MPVYHIRQDVPPWLVTGGKDTLVYPQNADSLQKALHPNRRQRGTGTKFTTHYRHRHWTKQHRYSLFIPPLIRSMILAAAAFANSAVREKFQNFKSKS